MTDVSDAESVAELKRQVLNAHGTVHVLHCNAGLSMEDAGALASMEKYERTLARFVASL